MTPAPAPRRRPRAPPGALLALLALLIAHALAPAAARSLAEARALAEQGEVEQALEALDALLALEPQDVRAQLLRGVLLSRTGRSEAAIAAFEAIARAHPELPEPHNNLAVLYAAQGRYDDARAALLEAIRLEPDYAIAHENLGDVYAKLAALAYTRAHDVDPDNRRALRKADAAEALLGESSAGAPPAPAPRAGEEASPAPATAQAPAPGAGDCVAITGIRPPGRAQQIAEWLRARGLEARVGQPRTGAASPRGWRVYLPPLASAQAARARIEELRAAGLRDLILITDGEHRNGVSLGYFTRKASAERRARDLFRQGIESRIEALGAGAAASARVDATGPFSAAEFARAFPEPELRTGDCP